MLKTCLNKLSEKNVRPTKNREVILRVLHEAKGPLAPPEVVKECHRLGRQANKTTIYRELEQMERVGVVQKVMVSDRKQYFELTERGHHHHFICRQCDGVEGVKIEETALIQQAQKLGKKLSFLIEQHAVEFYGLCRSCQR